MLIVGLLTGIVIGLLLVLIIRLRRYDGYLLRIVCPVLRLRLLWLWLRLRLLWLWLLLRLLCLCRLLGLLRFFGNGCRCCFITAVFANFRIVG